MNRLSGWAFGSLLAACAAAASTSAQAQNQVTFSNGLSCTWTSASISPSGNFNFVVTADCGSTSPATAPPVCSTPTVSPAGTIAAGGTASLSVSCTNSPTSYTWLATSGGPSTASTTNSTGALTFMSAGTYGYQVTARNGAGSGTAVASVVVTASAPVATPVCSVTANPAAIPSTGGSATLAAQCTNVSAGSTYAWTAQAGAPGVIGTGSVVTVTFPSGAAAGSYAYQVTATNAAGTGAPAMTGVTVLPPVAAGCVIKDTSDRQLYPNWTAGNNYYTAHAPLNLQPKNETWAFKFPAGTLINTTNGNAASAVQLYETGSPMISVSVSAAPCDFSDAPAAPQCQRSGNSGSLGLNFVVSTHAASDTTIVNAGYCRAPAITGSDVYVNVKYAAPPSVVNPAASTCTLSACSYYLLYQKLQ